MNAATIIDDNSVSKTLNKVYKDNPHHSVVDDIESAILAKISSCELPLIDFCIDFKAVLGFYKVTILVTDSTKLLLDRNSVIKVYSQAQEASEKSLYSSEARELCCQLKGVGEDLCKKVLMVGQPYTVKAFLSKSLVTKSLDEIVN